MWQIVMAIIIVVVIALLMIVQSILSKLENWVWGAIIPVGVILCAICVFSFTKIKLQFSSVLIFAIPLIWSLEDWVNGRKKLEEKKKKEIELMKAKDIE